MTNVSTPPPPPDSHRPIGLELSRARLLFGSYLEYANKSSRTVGTYLEAVDLLAAYLQEQGMPTDVGAIGAEHLQAFFVALKRKGNAPGTISNRYRAIHRFFSWLVDEAEEGLRAPRWSA